MSNTWFSFKQFTIHQERSAMKVSTDACIQGAWTPVNSTIKQALDIGCGTGLLSLMLAQRQPSLLIQALELDQEAALEAKSNAVASPFAERILIRQGDARTYTSASPFDLIICNPPFFNNSLLGPATQRNQARHSLSLSQADLFGCIDRNLSGSGSASVLLPVTESGHWQQLLHQNGWYTLNQLRIIPRPGASANRIVHICSRIPADPQEEDLLIRERSGAYTPEFTNLLRPFYLKL